VHHLHGMFANMPSPKGRLLSRDSDVKKARIGWFFGHAPHMDRPPRTSQPILERNLELDGLPGTKSL
jgi:hypothetical protein